MGHPDRGYYGTGVCDLGAYASEGTKVEDEGETSGVVCSRHGLIASPADVAKMRARERGDDSLLSGRCRFRRKRLPNLGHKCALRGLG
jgi:hypothetical protein